MVPLQMMLATPELFLEKWNTVRQQWHACKYWSDRGKDSERHLTTPGEASTTHHLSYFFLLYLYPLFLLCPSIHSFIKAFSKWAADKEMEELVHP